MNRENLFLSVRRTWKKPLSNHSPAPSVVTNEKNYQSEPSPETPLIKTECTEIEDIQPQNLKKEPPIGRIFENNRSAFDLIF